MLRKMLNQTRSGKLYEFASYLMYNPKAMRDLINFVKFAAPITNLLLILLFLHLHINVVAFIFMFMFLITAYQLYKFIQIKGYKHKVMNLHEMKGIVFNKQKEYGESEIVSTINKKYKR